MAFDEIMAVLRQCPEFQIYALPRSDQIVIEVIAVFKGDLTAEGTVRLYNSLEKIADLVSAVHEEGNREDQGS